MVSTTGGYLVNRKDKGSGKGRGAVGLWEDRFEDLNATIDTTVLSHELRMKSQYAQKW